MQKLNSFKNLKPVIAIDGTAGSGKGTLAKKLAKNKNCVIGFGITDQTISSFKSADGVVVGSLNSKIITNAIKKKHNPVTKLSNMSRRLKNKIS